MEDIEVLVDKIASFLEREENWIELKDAWKINDRSEAVRSLLREALKEAGSMYLSEGTYMLVEKDCPFCGEQDIETER
jgi:hypothetical protein